MAEYDQCIDEMLEEQFGDIPIETVYDFELVDYMKTIMKLGFIKGMLHAHEDTCDELEILLDK